MNCFRIVINHIFYFNSTVKDLIGYYGIIRKKCLLRIRLVHLFEISLIIKKNLDIRMITLKTI